MIGNVEISSKGRYYRIVGNIEWKSYDNLDNLKKELIDERHKELVKWVNSDSRAKTIVERLEWTDVKFFTEE